MALVVFFGPLEGNAGVLEQVHARAGIALQLHVATGDGQLVRNAFDVQRHARGGHQGVGVDLGFGPQHAKYVAADACQHRVQRQAFTQALGHRAEQQVAKTVPHDVVGGAEVVDVHQRQRMPFCPGRDLAVQRIDKTGAVGQAHQLVVERELVQALHQVAVAQQVADVEAEHVEQTAVGALGGLLGVDENRHVAAVAVAHVQRDTGW